VIDYVFVAEQRNGATLTLGDALAELRQDIGEAAWLIETILHPISSRDSRLAVSPVLATESAGPGAPEQTLDRTGVSSNDFGRSAAY